MINISSDTDLAVISEKCAVHTVMRETRLDLISALFVLLISCFSPHVTLKRSENKQSVSNHTVHTIKCTPFYFEFSLFFSFGNFSG